MSNWLDRSIGWFAPSWGAKRSQARSMMLAYDGAKTGRRTDGWTTLGHGSSADTEIAMASGALRDRARDLVRNNPHAAKGLAVIVANKIGTGIMCQPAEAMLDGRRPNKRKNDRLNERWKRWVDNCDIEKRLDLYGIQTLAERTRSESGEAIVRFLPTRMENEFDVPFRLRVLEPDFIDDAKNEGLSDGSWIRNGVEFSGGVAVAYWLFDAHPGDNAPHGSAKRGISKRVIASEVIHYFKPLRPSQSRGVTDFAPVVMSLLDLGDYDAAERMRKKIAACAVGTVTTPAGLPGASIAPTSVNADGERVEQFRPGMISYLKPGEAFAFHDPHPSADYAPYNKVQLHAVAAGLGIPYELLTGDLSEVTYTSHRGGLVQFRGMVEADQWQVVVPQICRPICHRFTREAAGVDGQISPYAMWTYTPPRFGLLDPAKEIPPMIEAIQGGLMSYDETVRREGYDPAETLDAIEAWQKKIASRGIVLTSDPRTKLAEKAAADPGAKPAPSKPEDEDAEAA